MSSIQPTSAEGGGGLQAALEPIQAAVADLQSSQVALQEALERGSGAGGGAAQDAWQGDAAYVKLQSDNSSVDKGTSVSEALPGESRQSSKLT